MICTIYEGDGVTQVYSHNSKPEIYKFWTYPHIHILQWVSLEDLILISMDSGNPQNVLESRKKKIQLTACWC